MAPRKSKPCVDSVKFTPFVRRSARGRVVSKNFLSDEWVLPKWFSPKAMPNPATLSSARKSVFPKPNTKQLVQKKQRVGKNSAKEQLNLQIRNPVPQIPTARSNGRTDNREMVTRCAPIPTIPTVPQLHRHPKNLASFARATVLQSYVNPEDFVRPPPLITNCVRREPPPYRAGIVKEGYADQEQRPSPQRSEFNPADHFGRQQLGNCRYFPISTPLAQALQRNMDYNNAFQQNLRRCTQDNLITARGFYESLTTRKQRITRYFLNSPTFDNTTDNSTLNEIVLRAEAVVNVVKNKLVARTPQEVRMRKLLVSGIPIYHTCGKFQRH